MPIRSRLFTLLALLAVVSCEEHEPAMKTGHLELSFSTGEPSTGGRVKSDVSFVLISIEDAAGTAVHSRKKIALYKFDGAYLSEPIALTAGNFKLTEFMVLDADGAVRYATPLQGSPLAYLVEAPLPKSFTITPDQTAKVANEVIAVEGNTSAEFGYATFSLQIAETFTFTAGVLAYDPGTKNFELTTARMEILNDGQVLFDSALPAVTNDIRIKDGYEHYLIRVHKEGYSPWARRLSSAQLKEHVSGSPLVIALLNESLEESLVAYYPFNGSANDETNNNLDGIVHGAVLSHDRHGVANAAYSFDGVNDYIQVPHDERLNPGADFTISLWAEVAGDQSPEDGINDILRKWNGNAEGYPFSISYLNPLAADESEDRILFARYDGQLCDNALETHSPTVANETFVHIALVREGGHVRTYLNNELIADVLDPTACSTANTADMTIGCRGNLVRFFRGSIDDIRIYSRALSSDEVSTLYGE